MTQKYIHTHITYGISEEFERIKEMLGVNNKQIVGCAAEYTLENEYADFKSFLVNNYEKIGMGQKVQVKIDPDHKEWISNASDTTGMSQKGIVHGMLRFCLREKTESFRGYLLNNTPDPSQPGGSSIKKADTETREMIEDKLGVDEYMKMGKEEAQEEIEEEIWSLGEE
ncbi:MAG: hypothetical protein ABEH81_01405 [Halopenitus sp.]